MYENIFFNFQNSNNNNDKQDEKDEIDDVDNAQSATRSDAPSPLASPRQDSGYDPTWTPDNSDTQDNADNADKLTDDIYYQFLSDDQKRALDELQGVPGGLDLKPEDHLFQYLTEDQKNALMEIENLKIDLAYTGENSYQISCDQHQNVWQKMVYLITLRQCYDAGI